jgi:hypothetical protein
MEGRAMTRDELKFTAADFDTLREALKIKLEDVLPERDHRELILDLIHAVKWSAAVRANAILASKLERAPEVFGKSQDESGWGCAFTKTKGPADT